jgi:hypothetical protein
MNKPTASQADKRVPIALGVLTTVLLLLGAHRIPSAMADPIPAQALQTASALVSSGLR